MSEIGSKPNNPEKRVKFECRVSEYTVQGQKPGDPEYKIYKNAYSKNKNQDENKAKAREQEVRKC